MLFKIISRNELCKSISIKQLRRFIDKHIERLLNLEFITDDKNLFDIEKGLREEFIIDKRETEIWLSKAMDAQRVGNGSNAIDMIFNDIGIDIKSISTNKDGKTNEASVCQKFKGDHLDRSFEAIDLNLVRLQNIKSIVGLSEVYDDPIVTDTDDVLIKWITKIHSDKWHCVIKKQGVSKIIHLIIVIDENKTDFSFLAFELMPQMENENINDYDGLSVNDSLDLFLENRLQFFDSNILFFDIERYLNSNKGEAKNFHLKNVIMDENWNIRNDFGSITLYKSKKRIELRLDMKSLDAYTIKIKLNKNRLDGIKNILCIGSKDRDKDNYIANKVANAGKFLLEIDSDLYSIIDHTESNKIIKIQDYFSSDINDISNV